jgi:hypothetical protein
MTYTADGEKLTKTVTGGATKNYVAGIEYTGANLEAIYHGEGRCTPNGATARGFVVINKNLSQETYSSAKNGETTSPCSSCVVAHEFLDHALPYSRNPNRIFDGGEGVEYHNKALKVKGSVPRNGKDHDDRIHIKKN